MQFSSSLGRAPVSVSALGPASGAAIGSESRKLNANVQRVPDTGVVVELSPAAEAVLAGSGSDGGEAFGNPLAPAGLQDVMADVELFGTADDIDLPGVFQLYENPAAAEAEEAEEASSDDVPVVGTEDSEEESAPGNLSEDERVVVDKLKARDSAVRAHEMAHVAAAGGLAGAPVFSYQTGPDGRRYAIGGSVSIDTSAESSPEDTIAKAQRIRSAALAPADPSAADRAVASRASRMESQARQALASRQAADSQQAMSAAAEAANSGPQAQPVSSTSGVDTEMRSPELSVPESSVSSVIPGGIAILASERNDVRTGPSSSTLRSEDRRLGSFAGGSAAVAQLYTPTERSLEAAFQLFAS